MTLSFPLLRFIRFLSWTFFLSGVALLIHFFLLQNSILPFLPGPVLGAILLFLWLISGLIGRFWYKFTRRGFQLKDPQWQFHWLILSTYRGTDDPTCISAQEALAGLKNWSCPNPSELFALIQVYEKGEKNIAFDNARLLWLAELGHAAGWVSQEELLRYSTAACTRIRQTYSQWNQFADALMEGRQAWYNGKMPLPEHQKAILDSQYGQSLLANIPWS